MKNQQEKMWWILDYMADPEHKNEFFDITAEPFVNAYVDKFNPEIVEWYPYGAPKVPEIGKLLLLLYREDVLIFVYQNGNGMTMLKLKRFCRMMNK